MLRVDGGPDRADPLRFWLWTLGQLDIIDLLFADSRRVSRAATRGCGTFQVTVLHAGLWRLQSLIGEL